ncbi:MAG: M48 family metallopeptidase [Pseudomonadales bacterium]|nr:M48 family metallopeptidase [Pseudomonadales bacterium]
MDFFEAQNLARRNTRFLLLLFLLAVASLIILTNLLIFVFVNFQDSAHIAMGQYYFSWEVFFTSTCGVVLLITLASLFRLLSLRKGGAVIAELMDGELLVNAQGDLNKHKLLNVVEEMAIASGTPVPPVYLIGDPAINAFAAGYSPGDAVIGVTHGAMENLTRDQLQGVIAHEFSHILNGDMRLNIRLMGILYGILMLALVGRTILRGVRVRGRGRGRAGTTILVLGAGLMMVGYLGQFFGNLIKAAVSRQREFLADASAVQFTRNPEGIADALKRIGGYKIGSVLQHPESAEISHTFFSEGVSFSFASLMATHPPLPERIKRIEPLWNGGFLESTPPEPPTSAGSTEGVMGFSSSVNIDADEVLNHIGNPQQSQVDLARQIIAALPDDYTAAAREPYSARALVYLLMLNQSNEARTQQLSHLKASSDLGVYDALEELISHEHLLNPEMKLPLLEIALPTLRQLSYAQYKMFMANLNVLIRADGRVGLSEWAVLKMISKHLGEVFEAKHTRVRHDTLESVRSHCEVLLSLLAYCDKQSGVSPDVAFVAGKSELGLEVQLKDKKDLNFKKMNAALDALAELHPLRKPKLIKACIKTISADQVVSVIESELLRTIADTLECPMPPMLNPDIIDTLTK